MIPCRAPLTLLAATVTWCCIALLGCSATLVPPDGLTDARVQAVELQRRVKELEGTTAELQAQLAAAQEQLAQANAVGATDREVAEATPRMVTLAFAGGSAEWSTVPAAAEAPGADESGRHALVRVAVEPRDGLGRVLQVAGRCEVTVAIVDPAGKVIELGHRAVAPGELRAAWRAAFMGTHYSLEIPVVVPASAPPKVAWTVAVSCTDGWTRQTFRTSGSVAAPRQ